MDEALYSPWNDKRKKVVQTRFNTKDNTVREAQPSTPEKLAQRAEQTPEIIYLMNRHPYNLTHQIHK